MLKSRSQQVTIELMGGLGNQLFALTAGLYAAHKLRVTLRPHLREPGPSETTHTSSVHSLLADLPVIASLPGLEGVLLKIRLGIRNFVVKIGVPAPWINRATKLLVSPVVGYSKSLDTAKPGDYIVGYFQTHRYFDELRNENRMPKLALSKESKWFRDQLQKLEATNPIVIHVRRGDYLKIHNDYIGALSLNYYLEALGLITGESESPIGGRPIWVFSDQPSLVRQEFRGVEEFETAEFIEAPYGSDPAESLILMSSASSIVISNSTFSWWSAALSKDAKIVAPNKWFKKSDDPDSLIPSSWLRAESSWIEKLHSES